MSEIQHELESTGAARSNGDATLRISDRVFADMFETEGDSQTGHPTNGVPGPSPGYFEGCLRRLRRVGRLGGKSCMIEGDPGAYFLLGAPLGHQVLMGWAEVDDLEDDVDPRAGRLIPRYELIPVESRGIDSNGDPQPAHGVLGLDSDAEADGIFDRIASGELILVSARLARSETGDVGGDLSGLAVWWNEPS